MRVIVPMAVQLRWLSLTATELKGVIQCLAFYYVQQLFDIMCICRFTLDPSIGEFILTAENLQIPADSKTIYSVNDGTFYFTLSDDTDR